jgi:hypothetical protein
MAIFFPCFTLLEDFGFLPRVAFNLDRIFQKAGAHGKQALTMAMGLGCNAAGVVATRIIDSPRERLIAIITNNFSLCNGRWPTQILMASVFIGTLAPKGWGGSIAALSVLLVALLGFGFALLTSWMLARTVLRPGAEAESALATVAVDAVELLGAGDGRLRLCEGPGCSLLFHDGSRPGRRRWCSTERCGNRFNTATYRRRRAGAEPNP